jgi:gliding motility-associated lipoprotein GldH
MKTKNINYIIFVFVTFCITSCDSKREYDSFVSISNNSWEKENAISFLFEIKDTINKKELFINIRNNQKYNYSNLFLITTLNFPNGKKILDTLEYEMTDNSGRFLGNGLTGIKENKLFYKENVIFPTSGEYSVSISQAMRKSGDINGIESLEGVTDVGFRIEKN